MFPRVLPIPSWGQSSTEK